MSSRPTTPSKTAASSPSDRRSTFRHLTGYILHTPGHTQGSVCLHLPAQTPPRRRHPLRRLRRRTDLPGGDSRLLIRSIHDRLLNSPDTTIVIPGHGPGTTIGEEARVESLPPARRPALISVYLLRVGDVSFSVASSLLAAEGACTPPSKISRPVIGLP